MSLKAKCEVTCCDFKSNVALMKSWKRSAFHGNSILLHHDQPRYASPSSRRPKRSLPTRRQKRSRSKDGEEGASSEPASTTSSFTKVLQSECTVFTPKCCRLLLPGGFCAKQKVERTVTMTDSTGHKLWRMRFQSYCYPRVIYAINNGWREFSYDHNLKVNDRLVFTLVSSSCFLVEFASSNGSTRAMLPTRDGKDYPWRINYSRLDCLALANDADFSRVRYDAMKEIEIRTKVQAAREKEIRKKVASIIVPNTQKPQKKMFCQCNTVKAGNGKNITNNSRKEYVLPELTHLVCKYPNGSAYLQIVDSDSEISGVDEA